MLKPSSKKNRTGKKLKAACRKPILRIYIAQHCWGCQETLKLAEEFGRRFTEVGIEVIDLGSEHGKNLDDVFSVPTYVLDGQVISLGNPTPDELSFHLQQALA